MFDKDKIYMEQDLLFRSILEEGQEPVPAHIWDRIEEDLDRIAQRRRTVLWFRRTAVGVAAAAVLALGLFLDWGGSSDIVNPVAGEGMIAVLDQESTIADHEDAQVSEMQVLPQLIAMAEEVRTERPTISEPVAEVVHIDFSKTEETPQESDTEVAGPAEKSETSRTDNVAERFPDIWPEDEDTGYRKGVSLVLSGVTGTNSAQNSNRVNPMRRPGISAAPDKTGIKETSTNTTYNIPISVGAGIKFDFAPRWSVATGINYTLLSRKFYGTYTEIGKDGSILSDISSDINGSQHYLGIPVNVYYDIIRRDNVNFYAYAGGSLEKCIMDKYQVLSTNIVHKEKVDGLQLSAGLGMGVEFMVARYLGIYLDPSLRYYFENNQPKSIRTAQPLMFGFEMGLRFRL